MDKSDQKILYQRKLERLKRCNPELFAHRNRRWTKIILLLLLTECAVAFVTYLCMQRYGSTPALYIGILFAAFLPFSLLRIQDYFERPKLGRLTDAEYFMRMEGVHRFDFSRRMITRCYVKHGIEGSRDSITLEQKYEHYYRPGDTVMTVPGIKFPINLTPHDDVVCPKCGTILHKHNPECVGYCNMPRVKLPD